MTRQVGDRTEDQIGRQAHLDGDVVVDESPQQSRVVGGPRGVTDTCDAFDGGDRLDVCGRELAGVYGHSQPGIPGRLDDVACMSPVRFNRVWNVQQIDPRQPFVCGCFAGVDDAVEPPWFVPQQHVDHRFGAKPRVGASNRVLGLPEHAHETGTQHGIGTEPQFGVTGTGLGRLEQCVDDPFDECGVGVGLRGGWDGLPQALKSCHTRRNL